MNNIEIGVNSYLYPSSSVIWTYTLLGGAIGGAIVGFSSVLFEVVFGNSGPMFAMIMGIILFITVGAIIGLAPSILTGWFISRHRIRIIDVNDYLKLFIVGFIMTTLCLMLLITALELQGFIQTYLNATFNHSTDTNIPSGFNIDDILVFLKGALFLGIIGGLSSSILGKFVVPKVIAHNHLTQ